MSFNPMGANYGQIGQLAAAAAVRCSHTPLEHAKERAKELRRAIEANDALRVELAILERMIEAAEAAPKAP